MGKLKFKLQTIIKVMLIFTIIIAMCTLINRGEHLKRDRDSVKKQYETVLLEKQQLEKDIVKYDTVIKEIDSIKESVYTNTTTNMREKPDDKSKIIKTYKINTKIIKIGTTGKWTMVLNEDGKIYYIYSKNISKNKTIIVKKKTVAKPIKNNNNKVIKKATGTKAEYQAYAHNLVINTYGWSEADYEALVKLWNRESGWNPNAHNKSSGAHGIPQSLPASKMKSEGADYYTNGYTQIRWGLKYIKQRYGSPSAAWAHSQKKGWY